MLELAINVLATFGLIAALAVLAAGIWIQLVSGDEVDEVDEHWPDEDATLDVANHIGDSRPIR